MPPEQWPAATRLRVAPDPMAAFDRAVVALAFLASLVLIVGSFLPWVRFDGAVVGEASAWDRHSAWANDGLLVMIAGVVGATASGALLAGGRSLFAKLCMLAAGLGAFAVFLVDVIDTGRENKAQPTVDIETGIGLWLVGVAAVVLVAAALLERSPWRWKADGP